MPRVPADRLLVGAQLLLLVLGAVLARRGAGRAARGSLTLVMLSLASMMGARWAASGHPPVFGAFEMDLAESFVLLALGVWLAREAGDHYLAATAAVASLTLSHTFLVEAEATPLTISEQSLWIDLHAALAWLAWGLYLHALLLAFRGTDLQDRSVSLLGHAFAAHTGLGFVGAYYSTLLFATPWAWDPVQTLGLLSWILAGLALHFRLFFGISPRRQRYFLCVVVASYLLAAKAIVFLPAGQSFHVFELGSMAAQPR